MGLGGSIGYNICALLSNIRICCGLIVLIPVICVWDSYTAQVVPAVLEGQARIQRG